MKVEGRKFVLRLRIEVAAVVPLMQLARRLTPGAVDLPTPLNGRTLRDLVGPAQHVLVLVHTQELTGLVELAFHQRPVLV